MNKKIGIRYMGGKRNHLRWLLPLLPATQCYVEPFGGGAAVLLNRAPSPSEIYNDTDGDVVNFFRQLRDAPDALARAVALTPHAREEFKIARSDTPCDDLERARRFAVRSCQSMNGRTRKSESDRDWLTTFLTFKNYDYGQTLVGQIPALASRLRSVQIDSVCALEMVARHADNRDVLMYVDPPYVNDKLKSSSDYKEKISLDDYKELLWIISNAKARVCMSGYRNAMIDKALYDFRPIILSNRKSTAGSYSAKKGGQINTVDLPQEHVFINYQINAQAQIF